MCHALRGRENGNRNKKRDRKFDNEFPLVKSGKLKLWDIDGIFHASQVFFRNDWVKWILSQNGSDRKQIFGRQKKLKKQPMSPDEWIDAVSQFFFLSNYIQNQNHFE